MNARDIIVIGASAGGVEALRRLVTQFPDNFPASIFVVRHIGATAESFLPEILERAGTLKASHALDGEPIVKSRIYVAPPDRHMMIEDECIRLSRGPKENRSRPAVDALFRSAALALRTRVIGVILTGALDDGTAGLWSIKYRGGIAVVQDPTDAEYSQMPQSALDNVRVDHCVPVGEMGSLLLRLAQDPGQDANIDSVLAGLEVENRIAFGEFEALTELSKLGILSALSCPDCHGALISLSNGSFTRFRCSTGHAYTATSLLAEQHEATESILFNALRALEETAVLRKYLRDHRNEKSHLPVNTFSVVVEKYKARLIHRMLTNHDAASQTVESSPYPIRSKMSMRPKTRRKRVAL